MKDIRLRRATVYEESSLSIEKDHEEAVWAKVAVPANRRLLSGSGLINVLSFRLKEDFGRY